MGACITSISSNPKEPLRPPSPFAACFNSPDHSDVLLHVYTDPVALQPSPRSNPAAASPAARSYHCHAVILVVHSAFFKAQLSSAWQESTRDDGNTSPASASKRTVDIHVAAEELDALHELLRMLYSQALPAVTPADPAYLKCMKLADRFKAVSCMEVMVAGLAAAPVDEIDCAMLDYVFRASTGVCASRSYPALLESCSKALVRLFGDVPTVIGDAALQLQFCSLPHAAVLAWVKSADLQVHSENCVVFLLTAWVQANKGSSAAQHEELAHHIRVFHLGPAYLHQILPGLGWFKDCSNMPYLPSVLSCIRAGITMAQGMEAEKDKMYGDLSWPHGWCAKPRQRSNSSRTGSWVLTSSQVAGIDLDPLVLPSPFYVHGFLMKVRLQQQLPTSSTASAPNKTLGVFVGVDRAAMGALGLPWPDKAMSRIETIHVKVGSASSEKRKEDILLGARILALSPTIVWGQSNFLGAAAPTILELLGPYLQQGQLHVEVTFSAVDT